MWLLISAVATASLLGSTHCIGMCGPIALWAAGTTEVSQSRVAMNSTLYHLGRLIAYAAMGCLAGGIGELIDIGGDSIGLRMAAARVVGTAMVAFGMWRLARLVWPKSATGRIVKPSLVGRLLARMRPFVFQLPISARASNRFADSILALRLALSVRVCCHWHS